MPRTAHGAADEKPLRERAAVMRAYGAYRKKLFTTTNEDQRFALCVAEHHLSFGQARKRHALREIGPYEFRVLVAHSNPP